MLLNTQFFKTMDDLTAVPTQIPMPEESRTKWLNAVQVLCDEALSLRMEEFKKSVLDLAHESLGEDVTLDDVFTLMNPGAPKKRPIIGAKPVCQYSLDGTFVGEFDSMTEAAKSIAFTVKGYVPLL